MRVISGTQKGRRLSSLPSNDVRPTTDKVKEAIFSSIQFDIEGRRFLDLFAGSGQIGIEALSRGAKSAVFVDASKDSIKVIKENISSCKFEEYSKVVFSDALSFLSNTKETFDIVFLDPPYAANYLNKALLLVVNKMSDFGIIICEHPTDLDLPENIEDFVVFKRYRYGKISVTTFKKEF